MKRYWVPQEWVTAEGVRLTGEVFKHIHRVCRNDVGSKFEVLTDGHLAYFVELVEVEKRQGLAKIIEQRKIPELPKPWIELAVSIPRFQKLDFIIEKAVELGVRRVRPFTSDFSFVRTVEDSLLKKTERWKKIVQGATQQCGRGERMDVASPQSLDQLLEEFASDKPAAGFFPYEGECELGLGQALKQLQGGDQVNSIERLWIFVGSEGGFSEQEVKKFQSFGLQPLTLGPQVLRVDTACITLVAILKYEFRLMEG